MQSGGRVRCWGNGADGRLGNRGTANVNYPVSVMVRAGVDFYNLGNIVQVDAGVNYTCARNSLGTAYCWGLNSFGQLGRGNTSNSNSAEEVHSDLGNPSGISAGNFNSCALISGGGVKCWGYGSLGAGR